VFYLRGSLQDLTTPVQSVEEPEGVPAVANAFECQDRDLEHVLAACWVRCSWSMVGEVWDGFADGEEPVGFALLAPDDGGVERGVRNAE